MKNKTLRLNDLQPDQDKVDQIYIELKNKILELIEDNSYHKDINDLVPFCYSLVSIAADIMVNSTDMDGGEILKELSSILSETLGYDVEYQIEDYDDNDVEDPAPVNKNKKLLN